MEVIRIGSVALLFACFAALILLSSCKGLGREKPSATDIKADSKVGILQPVAPAKGEEKIQAGAEQVEASKAQDLQRTITEQTTTTETT